uniref:Uncharacterized protein n=1 Tax=Iconisemion striatum TaxID=60296 RepID=A0A1A7Y3C6_9TELE
MVTHALKDKVDKSEVGTMCLLCERRLSSDEIQAHVFSREHVTRFLNRIHPGSLNPSTDSEETFLDLAKQAARIHPVSNVQDIQLETSIREPCSYKTLKRILCAVKKKEGTKGLEPLIKPMMKLVSRVAQAEVDQNREKEGQKNSIDTDELENKQSKRVKIEVKVEEAAESCKNTEERPNMERETTLQNDVQLKNERKRPNATPEKSPKEKGSNEHLGRETTPKRPRLTSNDDSSPKKPANVPKSASKTETNGGSNRISATYIKLRCVGRDTIILCGSCSLKVDNIGHFTEIKHPKMHPVVVNLSEKTYNDISNLSFHSVIQMQQIQMLVQPWSDGGCSFSSASPPSAGAAINTSATRHCEDSRVVVDMELNSDSEGSATMPDSSATTKTLCKTPQDQEFKSHIPRAGLVQPHRPTITTTTTSLPPKGSEISSPDTTVKSLKFETAPKITEKAATTSVNVCKSASKQTKTISGTSTQSVSTKDETASEGKSASGPKGSSRNGPRSEEASKSSAEACVPAANVAKPPPKHVNASSPTKTAHVTKSVGEHANAHKRNSPTALSPNATGLSSSEHKNPHKDAPHMSATTKTPAGTLLKVGKSQLIVVVSEGKQQAYCELCSVKINCSSQYHLTSTDHHLNYVKMKFPEWTAKESELEKKLSHTVALLAKIEKDLPETQSPQRLEVSPEKYFNLGRLSEQKAVEKVKEMVRLKDSHDSCPVVDASRPLKQEICSPCEVSSSDDGVLVSRDKMMRCDQSEQEDENQQQTAVVQVSEMESSELKDQNLAAGDFIRDQFLDDDDDDGMETCVTKPVYTPGFYSEVMTEVDSDTNVKESPAADQLLRHQVSEEVRDQQNPILHSQSEAITEAKVVNDSRGSEHLFAPERQQRKSDSSGQQDQSPRKHSPVQLCSLQLQTHAAEQQNRPGPSRRAEPAELSVSQAQPTTLVGGRARGSSSLSLYLKARGLEAKHVIGMASVWECRGFENLKTFFLCESCEMTLSRHDICQHMISVDHQLKYLRKYHSEVMFWQELDFTLPTKLEKDILLNYVIQPISERELTLKMDAQCFVLSPELHRLVQTSPFDKALKIVKDLKGE